MARVAVLRRTGETVFIACDRWQEEEGKYVFYKDGNVIERIPITSVVAMKAMPPERSTNGPETESGTEGTDN